MGKHTPGPWKTRRRAYDFAVDGPSATRKFQLVASISHAEGRCEANANLIAAAPAMYEALGELLAYAWPDENYDEGPHMVRHAAKVLKQAEGR